MGNTGRMMTPIEGVPLPRLEEGSDKKIVKLSQIHVPVMAWIAAFSLMTGGIVSMTLVYSSFASHAANAAVHIDANKSIEGGGVAYKRDLDKEYARTRLLLTRMEIICKKAPAIEGPDALSCSVRLPESLQREQ